MSSRPVAGEAVTPGRQGWVPRHFARHARSYPRGYGLAGALHLGVLRLQARLGKLARIFYHPLGPDGRGAAVVEEVGA